MIQKIFIAKRHIPQLIAVIATVLIIQNPLSAQNTIWGSWIDFGWTPEYSGAIFKYNLDEDKLEVIYEFPEDQSMGASPDQGLLAKYGYVYGCARYGGEHEEGVLFCIDIQTGEFHKLHDFEYVWPGQEPNGDLVAYNGKLYGTAFWSGIWSYDLATNEFKMEHNFRKQRDFVQGSTPFCGLRIYNDKLYGVNKEGGIYDLLQPGGSSFYNEGTIFSFDPNQSEFEKLGDFRADLIGADPQRKLLFIDGVAYSTTIGTRTDHNDNNHESLSSLYMYDTHDSTFQTLIKFEDICKGKSFFIPTELYHYKDKIIGIETESNTLFSMNIHTKEVQTTQLSIDIRDIQGLKGDTLFIIKDFPGLHYYTYNLKTGNLQPLNIEESKFKGGDLFGNGICFPTNKERQQITDFQTTTVIDLAYNNTIQLSATTDSNLPVTFTSTDPSTITISNNTATFTEAGTFEIVVQQNGNDDYYAALPVKKEIYVFDSSAFNEPLSLETNNTENISLFPNPARDYFYVSADKNIRSVSILNLSGKVLLSKENLGGTLPNRISVSNISNGCYIVRVVSEKSKYYKKIFINN